MNRSTHKLAVMIFVLLSCLQVNAQIITRTWLPERYVVAVSNKDSLANIFLSPISGIMLDSCRQLLISGFGSEPNPVKYKVISVGDVNKFQLFNVEKHVNMKYESRGLVDSIEKARIFFSFNKSYAKLDIICGNRTREIYFVDRYRGKVFTNIREAITCVNTN